ncbi:MAG: hypothetical protein QMD04_03095 [Anaerolineales bacterium]|nr:hypothetical protein [Anaerolineales bacterium]
MKTKTQSAAVCAVLTLTILACTFGQTTPPRTEPGPATVPPIVTQPAAGLPPPADALTPADFEYLGAFRLPGGDDRPQTFAYGGNAMTFNPDGDSSGAQDGFPGSLFVMGHDRMPYGDLPDGNQLAEINIPAPVISKDLGSLNTAEFLQDFRDVTAGHFTGMEEIVRTGLLYLNNPSTGPLIHVAWGQNIEPDPTAATHGWFNADLSNSIFQGSWFIAGQSWYSVNDYMFEIPADWADAYIGGRYVATGRFKDGGWSGMGPAIVAYRPWDENGNPPLAGAQLESTTLLRYAASTETGNIERALSGYQHSDEWNGAAWLTTSSGKSAVLFVGTKSNGMKYWYGYANPAGPEFPCVDEASTDFLTCRMADGSSCSPQDFTECPTHNDYRGWWSAHLDSQFVLYDPADLTRVARGEMGSWEPQPYAVIDIDERLFFNPPGVEQDMLGAGVQRRYRIGDVAYDRQNNLLYVLELFADGAKPVVHVWRIR